MIPSNEACYFVRKYSRDKNSSFSFTYLFHSVKCVDEKKEEEILHPCRLSTVECRHQRQKLSVHLVRTCTNHHNHTQSESTQWGCVRNGKRCRKISSSLLYSTYLHEGKNGYKFTTFKMREQYWMNEEKIGDRLNHMLRRCVVERHGHGMLPTG